MWKTCFEISKFQLISTFSKVYPRFIILFNFKNNFVPSIRINFFIQSCKTRCNNEKSFFFKSKDKSLQEKTEFVLIIFYFIFYNYFADFNVNETNFFMLSDSEIHVLIDNKVHAYQFQLEREQLVIDQHKSPEVSVGVTIN